MAPATTPTVKILTDLGYQVWEMETDADMLMALVEAINTLSITNPNDGRISILQRAVKGLRVKRRSAAPSQGQKYTVTRKRLKASKFTGTAKPAATSRVNPVALLPAASEDQSVFSTLVSALTNIGSLLKRIGGILRIQFLFKKLLAARQRRKDALDEKRKREGELESNSGGLGKRITKTLTKPIKSFWSTLLGFFKNIIFGSALIGFLKWMKDPENLKKIVDISTWFYKHGKTIIATLVGLLALKLGFKILGIFVGLNRLLKLFRLGSLLRRIPWWKTAQAASGGRKVLTSEKPIAEMGSQMMTRMSKGKFLPMGSGIVSESANIASQIAGKSSTTLAPKIIDEGIERVMFEGGDDITARVSNFMVKTTKNITQVFDPERLTKGLLNLNTADTDKLVEQAIAEGGESAAQKKMNKLLTQGVTDTVAKSPTAFFSKGATEVLPEVGGMPGSDIMKLIGDKEALKKLLKNKFITEKQFKNLMNLSMEMPDFGKAFGKGMSTKVMAEAAKKLGFWGMVRRTLPFISTALDTWSAIEEFKKGNITSGLLFTGGALTSIVAPWWSLGLSLAGVAESIRIQNVGDNEELLNKIQNTNFAPDMSVFSLNDAYSIGTSPKKQQKVILVPVNTGGGQSNSTSDGSGTQVNGVSSTDGNNDNTSSSIYNYDLIGTP